MKFLVIWVLALSFLYSTLSIVRHNHFQSGGFDLGLYDQEIWQFSKLLSPYNTIKERFIFGDHLTLTLPLLAPLFWIWDDVRILLVIQALWISLSALAVYKIVLLRNFSSFTALVLSCCYSIFYGIQYGIFFDFHPVLLATGLIPWMLYFMEAKRTRLFLLSLPLLLLTQENMGLALASLGCIYIFKNKKVGLSFIVGGIAISVLSVKIINLFYPFQYMPHVVWNPVEFFNAPEKRQVWLYTMSAFSFLPLLSPGAMLAIGFDLAQYFITGPDFARMWSPFMHHRAILAPYVLLGTLDGLQFLKSKRVNITLVVTLLAIFACVQQFIFHFPLNKLSKAEYWREESWMQDNETLIATIDPHIALATQQSLIPHLSHRKEIYLFWPRVHDFPDSPCGQKSCWWLDTNDHAQYLLVDTHPDEWITMLLETPEHVQSAIDTMQKMGKLSLLRKIHNIALYKIN